MEKFMVPSTTLTAQTTMATSTDEVIKTVDAIEKYGLMPLMCGILLMFCMILFGSLIRRSNRDETIVKLLSDLTNVVNNTKNNNVDMAGSFDKHNTLFILETEQLKSSLKDLDEKLDDLEKELHNGLEGLREILMSVDQEWSGTRDYLTKSNIETRDMIREEMGNLQDIRGDVSEILRQIEEMTGCPYP